MATLSGRLAKLALIASTAFAGMRDTNVPAGIAIGPVFIGSGAFDDSYTRCYYSESEVQARMCENNMYTEGSMIVDPGCQTALMRKDYEPFMQAVSDSQIAIRGFDGSTQNGRKHGCADMYFMGVDPANTTGQGVSYTLTLLIISKTTCLL